MNLHDHVQSPPNCNLTRVSIGNSLPNVVSVVVSALQFMSHMLWHLINYIHLCSGQQVTRLLGTRSACWSRPTSVAPYVFEEWILVDTVCYILCRSSQTMTSYSDRNETSDTAPLNVLRDRWWTYVVLCVDAAPRPALRTNWWRQGKKAHKRQICRIGWASRVLKVRGWWGLCLISPWPSI